MKHDKYWLKKKIYFLINISIYNFCYGYINILQQNINLLNYHLQDDKSLNFYKITYNFSSRIKKPNSYINKIYRNNYIPRDLFGIRIIYDTPLFADNNHISYKILENIERNFITIPSTYDDYVSKPKKNGYSGIHINYLHKILPLIHTEIELQIKSQEMHYSNQQGKPSEYYLHKPNQKIFNNILSNNTILF